MMTCLTCGGRYEPVQRDGARYFHVCPPVTELRDKDGQVIDAATAAKLREASEGVTDHAVPRVNARDENAPSPAQLTEQLAAVRFPNDCGDHVARNKFSDAAIVSAGAGVAAGEVAVVPAELVK